MWWCIVSWWEARNSLSVLLWLLHKQIHIVPQNKQQLIDFWYPSEMNNGHVKSYVCQRWVLCCFILYWFIFICFFGIVLFCFVLTMFSIHRQLNSNLYVWTTSNVTNANWTDRLAISSIRFFHHVLLSCNCSVRKPLLLSLLFRFNDSKICSCKGGIQANCNRY